jgi:hypothetical protein
MKLTLKTLLTICLLSMVTRAFGVRVAPQERDGDSLEVSLLTCAPGHEVYRLYGHTALRVRNVEQPTQDDTYNFGWFSFNTPNFMLRFVLGRTDYSMAKESTALFAQTYIEDDAPVTAQVLDLTPAEARDVQKSLNAIIEEHHTEVREYLVPNLSGGQDRLTLEMPEWTYRYNFLYDNCTTRAIEAVEKVLKQHGERLVFPNLKGDRQKLTQRQMIHEFTVQSPWYEFGQDLLLGPEVDREFAREDLPKMNFLPIYAQKMWQSAKVQGADGKLRSLVVVESPLIPFTTSSHQVASPLTPKVVFWGLLCLAVLLTVGEQRSLDRTVVTRRAWRIWVGTFDTLFFVLTGLVGVVLTLLVGWSEHPAVGTNWLLTLFSPLWLLYMAFYFLALRKQRRDIAVLVPLLGAVGYFVAWAAGLQWFSPATVPLALILLLRGVAIFRRSMVDARRSRSEHEQN